MKRKIEQLIRLFIITGFLIYLLVLIISGDLYYFINPSLRIFTYFSTVAFLLMAVVQAKKVISAFKENSGSISRYVKLSYIVFCIPLILGFALPAKALDSFMIEKKGFNIEAAVQSSAAKDANSKPKSSDSVGTNTYDAESDINKMDVIKLEDWNFASIIEQLYADIDKNIGKEVEVKGFIFKTQELKENQFVIGRYIVTCCAADAEIIGLLCNSSDAAELAIDQWVIVKGIINKVAVDDMEIPVIDVTSIEKTDRPPSEYVYP
ncbi:MAG: TIGR03943 family putative permease subunit [Bacillota bacterium]